ncbi:MAG TPA: polymer-forming cytoskeletal protein [Conexibacter sp.]|nr:polymer-forming cytoskeletal protein [Conexibacter sp.]
MTAPSADRAGTGPVHLATVRPVQLAAAVAVAMLILLCVGSGRASADDQIVITGGVVVPVGRTVGDVVAFDGPVRIAGHATGDVVAIGGPVRITGRVDGDVAAVSDRAVLAPTARVGGDLLYGDERPVVARGARVDGSIKDKNWADTLSSPGWGLAGPLVWWLAVTVSTLLIGVLLLLLAPRMLAAAERSAREHLWPAVGWGVLVAIALPLIAILALVTLVGIPLGVALLLSLVPLMLIAYVTSAWILGRRILKPGASPWLALLVGWGVLRLLALIPVVGFLVGLVATVVGLGALVVALWHARGPAEPASAPEAPGRPAPV